MTFQAIVKFIAERNGLCADFSPKPLPGAPGSGFHINMSVKAEDGRDCLPQMVAGVLDKVADMTVFLNPTEESYARFGGHKAPKYISWSHENRSQLVRIPAAAGEYRRAELRSPDPAANPYLAFALMIQAGLLGMERALELSPAADLNLYQADGESLSGLQSLPRDRAAAVSAARSSEFIRSAVPGAVAEEYFKR